MHKLSYVRLSARALHNLLQWLWIVAGCVCAILALCVLLLRYWVLPNIENYREPIVQSLSQSIGMPLEIGHIEADWQGLRPRLNFKNVRLLDAQKLPVLVLPRVHNVLSWTSLFSGQLRLRSLDIEQPELQIRRDTAGKIYIGGVLLSQSESTDNSLADWVLHQRTMTVSGAKITWLDELRNAPPLVLSHVDAHVDNFFSHHRFGLRAEPDPTIAQPLALQGEFYGDSFDQLAAWRGRLFVQLNYTDVVAWRPWIKLPAQFSQGRGGVRAWLDISQAKLSQLILDAHLQQVMTQPDDQAAAVLFDHITGRFVWNRLSDGWHVSAKKLALQLHDELALPPTDIELTWREKSGELSVSALPLASVSGLLPSIPMDNELRRNLIALEPQGNLFDWKASWQGKLPQLESYKVQGKVENLAIQQVDHAPGVAGVSFSFEGDEKGGKLKFEAPNLRLDFGPEMREPIPVTKAKGTGGWQHTQGEWGINFDRVDVDNADLAGRARASYRTQKGTFGVLEVDAKLHRADVKRAARYTPYVALGKEGNEWLHTSLLSGVSNDLSLKIKGNLSHFPPTPNNDVLIELKGSAQGVTLDFANDWPRIEQISGTLLIHNNRLEVNSASGVMAGANLRDVQVVMPDMMDEHLPLEIKGQALASNATFLQFIQKSPVRGYIDGATDGMTATANGVLDLSLYLPLVDITSPPAPNQQKVKVAGSVKVQNADIWLAEGVPLLEKTSGELLFSESGMSTQNVTTHVFGGAATAQVSSDDKGNVFARAQGKNSVASLRSEIPTFLFDHLKGDLAWQTEVKINERKVQVDIRSDLLGVSSDFPEPFSKAPNEKQPLHIQRTELGPNKNMLQVTLPELLQARVLQQNSVVKRVVVNFSGTGSWVEKDGIWLVGSLPTLGLEGWGAVSFASGSSQQADDLSLSGMDVQIKSIHALGMDIPNLRVQGKMSGKNLLGKLNNEILSGDFEWQPQDTGRLIAHLKYLQLTGKSEKETQTGNTEVATNDRSVNPSQLPIVQLSIDDFQLKDKKLGAVEVLGMPEWSGWRLQQVSVVNPDFKLSGDGFWTNIKQDCKLKLVLDLHDGGKTLARLGYPNTMKAASGKLEGNVSWPGGAHAFAFSRLEGKLKLETGQGQFLKMNPGMGKLLSIFSLQNLPRRIVLDFRDVFSEGFQFDSIKGEAQINHGVMDIQNMLIDGSVAKVAMKGQVDLAKETQNLRVRVVPTLGGSVSLLGAFTAGPLVGVGTLLLNKILGSPIDKLAAFEYNITGSWLEPNVVKVGQESIPVKPAQ